MKCSKAMRLATIADELPAAQRADVDRHLSMCANCRAVLSIDLPLSELRSESPLLESDFAAVRARVMSSIATGGPTPASFAWRFAIAIVAAAVLAIAVFIASRPQTRQEQVAAREHPPARQQSAPAPAAVSAPVAQAPSIGAASSPESAAQRLASARPRRQHHRRSVEVTQEPLRIEIQTADPTIRIIWIANQDGEGRGALR